LSDFVPTPHPLLKLPSREQAAAMGEAKTLEVLKKREEIIRLETEDAYYYGFVLPWWKDAEEIMKENLLTVVFGGNGSAKTFFGSWKGVRTMMENPGCAVLFLHESEATSQDIQQKAVYHYLPKNLREAKFTRSMTANLSYTVKNGFSDNKFVLPNRSWARFGSYKQKVGDYEGYGWKLIVADENLPLAWLKTLLFRLPRAGGRMLWLYTPIIGMTPAIKHVSDGARTIVSKKAELLEQSISHVDDCPKGHMPYIRQATRLDTKLIYAFSEMNPYGGYEGMKKMLEGRDKETIEKRAYGFARNVKGTVFPLFGAHNILKPSQIPKNLSYYMVADPGGGRRNMFMIWAGVDPEGRHYVFHEWPDVKRYGEWAVESEDSTRWDGEMGPAQPTLGLSVVKYKELILQEEGNRFERHVGWRMCGFEIVERVIDSRAGKGQVIAERTGEKSVMESFEDEQLNKEGVCVGPSLVFEAASGVAEGEGLQAIVDLLSYRPSEPITRGINEPMLYVSEECQNLIWAMKNYTGHDGEKAACKDPIDVLRYMALAGFQYVDDRTMRVTGGGVTENKL
jgi:hypothetical protein